MLSRALHVVVAVTLLVALWGGQAASGQRGAHAAGAAGPKQYYLALGDSLAYGYQPNGDYTHGYADDFLQYLQSNGSPQLQLVNMACPGETTTTFMNGGCRHANMVKYPWGVSNGVTITNQLAGALNFIQQHPGQVGPVTIDIGVNDIITDIDPLNCLTRPRILTDATQAISNFTGILSQLKSALNGTGDILAMNYYDPYQLTNSNACQTVVQLTQTFNEQLQAVANNAGIPMADVFTAFGGDVLPPPSTGTATNTPTTGPGTATPTPWPSNPLCTYTWFCSATDVHPTTAGYAAIANAIEQIPYPPATPTPTFTATPIPACNPTSTPTAGGTATVTPTPTRRLLRSPTPTNTATPTVPPPTCTPTGTSTPTSAAGATQTPGQTSTTAASPSATSTPAPKYYLALGDSLAYGYQPNGDYTHGYADDLFTQYLQPRGFTALVNMACPNETTTTFMHGGCANAVPPVPLKYPWGAATSQLAAALAFIQAHPGQVKLVTINVGAADVLPDIDPATCTANGNVLIDGLAALNNVTNIVQQLQIALGGQGDLATITYYDPFQNECPNLDYLTTYLNGQIAQKAQQYGLFLADVYAAFGGSATPNPNLCTYTWICSTPSTVDATTQGHAAIAGAFEAALNYPLPPTSTPTATATDTATPVDTATPGGPPTSTPTNTSVPPTDTPIASQPTQPQATATATSSALTATTTATARPTATNTALPGGLVGPRQYYLALGDSLAYGYQPNGDYSHGYADDFFQYLKPLGTTTLVNMACPNETTVTFMNGNCPHQDMVKTSYGSSTSQLAAALAFIRAHPGQVSPVTINVGAQDILSDFDLKNCTNTPSLYQDLPNAIANFKSIMQQLKAALNGTGDLITLTYYNPYAQQCTDLAPLGQQLNQPITDTARQDGVLLADVFGAFGGIAAPNPKVCNLTWICSNPSTIDATTSGHALIAQALEAAVHYPGAPAVTIPGVTSGNGGSTSGTGNTSTGQGSQAQATQTRQAGPSSGAPTTTPVATSSAHSGSKTGSCPSRPPKAPLKVRIKQRSIASGNNLSLSINTIAHARITVTLLLQKTKITTTGKGKKKKTHKQTITLYRSTATLTANARGLSSGHLRVTYRPSKAVQVPLRVTVVQGCREATYSTKVTVTPAVHHKPAAKAKPKVKAKAKARHT
ncbi:MAG TPA: GDSL-type esterase/lipase family protein [Chloroflexota bacterium]|nr:GDSL-type esterase/lipase family protein [Chloroflexota bacterium]